MTIKLKLSETRSQQDSAWKDMLEVYFQEFMEFFYPYFAEQIQWETGYEGLDSELQALSPQAAVGKRWVDKLLKVGSRNGDTRYVWVHVEVQGRAEAGFSQRLFEYFYRLYDRCRQPVLTLAVLTDSQARWRPAFHQLQVWGWEVCRFSFHTVKLLDYRERREELERTENPFGVVVLAQLLALESRGQPELRFQQKFRLTRRLYERGWGRDKIFNLYKFLDWVLALPEDLELRYNEAVQTLEEKKAMAYITNAERIGIQKGIQQGLQKGLRQGVQQGEYNLLLRQLQRRFGAVPELYQQQLAQTDPETLLAVGEYLLEADSLEAFFQALNNRGV